MKKKNAKRCTYELKAETLIIISSVKTCRTRNTSVLRHILPAHITKQCCESKYMAYLIHFLQMSRFRLIRIAHWTNTDWISRTSDSFEDAFFFFLGRCYYFFLGSDSYLTASLLHSDLFFFSFTHTFPVCLFRIGIPDSAVINIRFFPGPVSSITACRRLSCLSTQRTKLGSQTSTAGYLVPLCHPTLTFFSPFVFLLRPTPWARGAVGNGMDWQRSVRWWCSSGRASVGPWPWTRFLWVRCRTRRSESRMGARFSTESRGTGCGTNSSSWRSTQGTTLSTSARYVRFIHLNSCAMCNYLCIRT